jgi:hypothetical protein
MPEGRRKHIVLPTLEVENAFFTRLLLLRVVLVDAEQERHREDLQELLGERPDDE